MKKGTKYAKAWYIVYGLLGTIVLMAFIFMYFGGFSTGENADPQEFIQYAQSVDHIKVPENVRIIALGEATHGNVEFQQLKLDLFKQMVENDGVRAFVIEGDYGGCEQVNRYIHGGEGTAQEAAAAIGFDIYRTEEMAELISYMRAYNSNVSDEFKLRFYGVDMQRYVYNFQLLNEACKNENIDTKALQQLMDGEEWSDKFNDATRIEVITKIKKELESKNSSDEAIHVADMLLQYCELQMMNNTEGSSLRDQFMAENVKWVLQQEQKRGNNRIFVSGHNSHVAKWGSFDSMGKLLSKEIGDDYYVIGTDFYKTYCNMPIKFSKKRTNQVFYSHNPLAKTAKMAGLDITWLDFSIINEESELYELISQYMYMGTLGEGYSWLMRLLPPSYRIFQPPAVLYDSMIFVTNATPIKIISGD